MAAEGKATRARRRGVTAFRHAVQVGLAFYLLYLGWQFYRFVLHFQTGGESPLVPRPAAVEGFLPIGALLALRQWLTSGLFDPIHPAALSILLAVLLVSLIFKKGFCSWLCPIGTLSESLGLAGQKLLGRSWRPPRWADRALMLPKYLLLGFFVYVIFFSMSIEAVSAFLRSPYNAISDVKMLQFFLDLSPLALGVLLALAALSLPVRHFWCRYLCPYGALLGLASLFSPLAVTRRAESCDNCRRCDRACPAGLSVSTSGRVYSPECTACLACVERCPREGALAPALGRYRLNPYAFGALLLAVFFLALAVARLTGHWQTALTLTDYRWLIPAADAFSHPSF